MKKKQNKKNCNRLHFEQIDDYNFSITDTLLKIKKTFKSNIPLILNHHNLLNHKNSNKYKYKSYYLYNYEFNRIEKQNTYFERMHANNIFHITTNWEKKTSTYCEFAVYKKNKKIHNIELTNYSKSETLSLFSYKIFKNILSYYNPDNNTLTFINLITSEVKNIYIKEIIRSINILIQKNEHYIYMIRMENGEDVFIHIKENKLNEISTIRIDNYDTVWGKECQDIYCLDIKDYVIKNINHQNTLFTFNNLGQLISKNIHSKALKRVYCVNDKLYTFLSHKSLYKFQEINMQENITIYKETEFINEEI